MFSGKIFLKLCNKIFVSIEMLSLTECNKILGCMVLIFNGTNAPINIKPHYPHPGYIGEKVRHLTCFETKTCPICGEFDRLPCASATIKSTDDQIPHIFLDF